MKLLIHPIFRNVLRNRLNSVINIIGLTFSMITFMVILSWIKSEKRIAELGITLNSGVSLQSAILRI